jgi:hydroxymethylpyrimidine kinase/phosphomethylpyrimidine kinase
MRAALTIAGSDSIAGAGLQADLKTFAAHGVYGTSAVTAITVQSTSGIAGVFGLPPELVRSQIDQVLHDVEISAVKTGMMERREIVTAVAETLARFEHLPIVVDPVMAATNPGARILLAPDAVSILKTQLLPLALVVTPNLSEAAELSGIEVKSPDSAREAAARIARLGPRAVVIKGGHLEGPQAIDLLFYEGTFTELAAPRADIGTVHGTGCTFASAIASRLALGDDVRDAIHRAKQYVTGAIEHSFQIGHGARILDHFWEHRH